MTIEEKFEGLRAKREKALVLFVTAGDPSLEELPAILSALQEGGVDIIEVGIPFSDPIADGPTIQASSQRALERGVTPTAVLDAIKQAAPEVPCVVMGYTNSAFRLGYENFAKRLQAAGVSGSILSDLTPEEAGEWIQASQAHRLSNIFLAAPTSTDDRLDAVCSRSSGFVYAVSRTGVTGAGSEVPSDVRGLVQRLKLRTQLPVCVGFGISKSEHVRMVCEVSDGAVIGSWLVAFLEKEWRNGLGREKLIASVRGLKEATRA